MRDRIEFYALNEKWYRGVELRARERYGDTWAFAQPLTFQALQGDPEYIDPFVTLEADAAQSLMDELWKCGVRPSEGQGSAGQLKAVQEHLRDMRTIAFKGLKI